MPLSRLSRPAALAVLVAVPPLAACASLLALPHPAEATELKCQSGDASDPHVVVDTRFVDPDEVEFAELRGPSVHSLHVVCWNPVEERFTGRVGEPVVYVLTNEFVEGLRKDLERVVDAQAKHRMAYSSFAADSAVLTLGDLTPGTRVELSASASGWAATLDGERLLLRCHVFVGSVTPPHAELSEGEPGCFIAPVLEGEGEGR